MFSFPTKTPEGKPQIDWYLANGTKVAYSLSVPPPVGEELWEHRQNDDTLVGKSLRVATGYGHYTTTDDLIAETEALADFWKLCEVDSSSGNSAMDVGLETLDNPSESKPKIELNGPIRGPTETVVPAIDLTGVRTAAVIALIALLSSFTLLILPGEKLHQIIAHVADTSGGAAGVSPVSDYSKVALPVIPLPTTMPNESDPDLAAIYKLISDRVVGGTDYKLEIKHQRILDGWACVISHGLDNRGMMITEPGHHLLKKQDERWVVIEYFNELRSKTRSDEEADDLDLMNLYSDLTQQMILKQYAGMPEGIFPEVGRPVANVEASPTIMQSDSTRTPQPSAAPTPQAAGDFLARLRGLENDHAIEAILTCYAERVAYFDHGIVDRDFIRLDKNTYYSRWPTSRHEIQGNVTIEGDGTRMTDANIEASYISRFELKNDEGRHLIGTTRSKFILAWKNDHFEITSEQAEVMDKSLLSPGRTAMKVDKPSLEMARSFVTHLRELENDQRLEDIMTAYASKVMYFKDGLISNTEVRKDKADYFQHWPVAKQTILGEVHVNALQDDLYQVSYESDFHTSNDTTKKAVDGRCRCLFTLRWQDGAFQVVQEGGEVLFKRDTGMGVSATPTKASQKQTEPKSSPKGKSQEDSFRESVRRFSKF